MGLPSVTQTGHSGMMAAKAAIATTGHNITNSSTEGYSRQKIHQSAVAPQASLGRMGSAKAQVGRGVNIDDSQRINDQYLEKQIRNSNRDLSFFEEKNLLLTHTEDVFNELNGEGLNKLLTNFFNGFRSLSTEPENQALRQSVREAAKTLVNDLQRVRKEVVDIRKHTDARLEGYVNEVNSWADEIRKLNILIKQASLGGSTPSDLLDKRDLALKNLGSYLDLAMYKDNYGSYNIDIKGVGPLVTGPKVMEFSVHRTESDDQGKADGAFDIKSSANASGIITHQIRGGKLGALLEGRDKTITVVLDKLDELAFGLAKAVNQIHRQGVSQNGETNVDFFEEPKEVKRAAQMLKLSDKVAQNVNNIAIAAAKDSPADNRIAVAIGGLQGLRILNEGRATFDEAYNTIVSEIGIVSARSKAGLNQQKDIVDQLQKMRDQISGVSIDEETANLLRYQHAFDASAKVIQVANDMLDTVLNIGRG